MNIKKKSAIVAAIFLVSLAGSGCSLSRLTGIGVNFTNRLDEGVAKRFVKTCDGFDKQAPEVQGFIEADLAEYAINIRAVCKAARGKLEATG